MSQSSISIVINNKRLSTIGIFLPTPPPPFIESKEQENFKLCRIDSNGICLPPSPNEINKYEKWHDKNNQDEDYFSFPANNLATPNKARSKHSTQAFSRLDTTRENNCDRTLAKFSQKAIVESPKTTENLVLQLEDTTIPPMSSSCSTSTSEESDIDDLNQKNSTVTSKPPVLQKHLTKDFDSYVSEFIRHSGFTMKVPKKRETPSSVFRNFF